MGYGTVNPWRLIPDDWHPSIEDCRYAAMRGLNWRVEGEDFFLANFMGNVSSPDWPAEWRAWIDRRNRR